MNSKISLLGFDADDTLWLNEHYYQLTETEFAALLTEFCDSQTLSDRLLETECRNLRLYGYGIKGFVLSMIETALELTENRLPGRTIRKLIDLGHSFLEHPVELLPHVQHTLTALHQHYPMILITKGDLFDQERKIALSGLAELFSGIEIVSEKSAETYRSLFSKYGSGPEQAAMIGNSLKSDIVPAVQAGAYGIYVPHGLSWALEHAEKPVDQPRFHELTSMAALPELLTRLNKVSR